MKYILTKYVCKAFIALIIAAILPIPSLVAAKTLRFAVTQRVTGLGNPYGSLIVGGVSPISLLFEPLTDLAIGGGVNPRLAESWEATSPSTWVFHLRTGVIFSNGEPFDADAAVAVINYLKSPEAQGLFIGSEMRWVESARVIDEFTLEITTVRPDAILPKRLSKVMMVPPNAWAEMGPDEFALNPSGTGPFIVSDWGTGSSVYVFARNPTTWRPQSPLDEIEFHVAPEPIGRAQALISGQVDLIYRLDLEIIRKLEAEGFVSVVRETFSVGGIALPNNRLDSPLADVRVRRALNYAIDRDSIARTILNGVTSSNGQGAIEGVFGFNPEIKAYPYDPERARALLAGAGYANGFRLKATVRSDPPVPEVILIEQVVAQYLAKVGVRLDLFPAPGAEWLRMYFSGEWGESDVLSFSMNSSAYADAIRAIETLSCSKPGAFFCVPEMSPLIEASNLDFEPVSRRRKLQDLMGQLHDLAPAIYLFPYLDTFAHTKEVSNLTFGAQILNIEDIIIAD